MNCFHSFYNYLKLVTRFHQLYLFNPVSLHSTVVQSLSCVWLIVTPWAAAYQASLSFTISRCLLKLVSIESVMPSNHLILCRPLLLPSVFHSVRVFSNESALHTKWPNYWSFRFSNRSLKRILTSLGWLVGSPCSPRDSQESSPTPQFKKASSLWCSAFFMV